MPSENGAAQNRGARLVCGALVIAAAVVGLWLLWQSIQANSATYDEVTYLRVAARWWRTGQQDEITRMGSPFLFWKLQQAPVLWLIDRAGGGAFIDDPISHQEQWLPLVRLGALWIWIAGLALTALWSRLQYGPRAMALAAWLYVLAPNLLAHGALVTMELPLVACTTGMLLLFWAFLATGHRAGFWASAAVGGLAFSCKYTTVLFPLILALAWWWHDRRASRVIAWMAAYVAVLLLANLVFTGFCCLPLSPTRGAHPSLNGRFGTAWGHWLARLYEMPLPRDWVGLANQIHHQMAGGPGYLLGQRGMKGWRLYYFIALAVKVPLTFWLLLAGRVMLRKTREDGSRERGERLLPITMILFLAIAAMGSSRNYGVRYLLPLFPLAIIWVSRLAEGVTKTNPVRSTVAAVLVVVGLAGQAVAVGSVHPYELTYFNGLAGGRMGGRRVLSDSNLDWGQGLKALARLQRNEPGLRDLTFYYFGDTEPGFYGVEGAAHVVNAVDPAALPELHTLRTRYVAVSASLQWGPWGPPGFFSALNTIAPTRLTADTTIAIYRTEDLSTQTRRDPTERPPVSTDHARGTAVPPDHPPARRPGG